MTKKLYEYDIDDQLEIILLIEQSEQKIARNGKPFLAITFQDKSGKMNGMYWDVKDDEAERFSPGTIVSVKGRRELYNGQPQLKIMGLQTIPADQAPSIQEFVESAPMTTEEMITEIQEVLSEIENENYARIIRYLLNKYHPQYFYSPAAKSLHHAYSGGLAFHTLSILKLAQTIVKQYSNINASLLYSGAILHDLGKIREMTGPIGTEYTIEGNLLGHIVMVDEEITLACHELEIDDRAEEIILLKHMILSHHGQLEYGSPVRPRLLEAEILNRLDDLDASITMISDALGRTNDGTFSERLFGMDNRTFYKAQSNSEDSSPKVI